MLFILLHDYKILFGVPKIFLLHKVVRDAKKVEKHCARELFKGSNGSASLIDYIRKKIFWLRVADFL